MAISNFLLQITDVKGESKEIKDWIDVETWSYGLTSPTDPVSKIPTGALQIADFSLTKSIDISSPILISYCKNNKLIPTVKLWCMRMNASGLSEKYYEVEMKNARIRAVSTKVQGPKADPIEAITISFQHIGWTIVSGGITTELDVTTGK